MPGRWGFYIALGWTALSLVVATALGPWGFGAAVLGLALAWAYSAPPIRLKRNGWWGNTAVALCYEGLPWFTGAAVMAAAGPDWRILMLAGLYSLGAHGIMTLNDFKSVEGDRRTGIGSLPVRLGVEGAARTACLVMAAPQAVVVALLAAWDRPFHAAAVAGLLAVQLALMTRLLREPKERAAWYNATGTSLYVLGMLVGAFALRQALPGGA
jgi:chlorophyll synthase